jgi:hypothetical protein
MRDAGALAPGGSQASRGVVRTQRALAKARSLPGPDDLARLFTVAVPKRGDVQVYAHGRCVPGHDLWVWYQATDAEIRFVALTEGL